MPRPVIPTPPTDFDTYAAEYEAALQQGLSVSGENSIYFAEGRVRWLQECLRKRGTRVQRVLDYGCGTGRSLPLLVEHLAASGGIGVDTSARSLEWAAEHFADPRLQWGTVQRFAPQGDVDVAFCNGVFHHIPVAQRPAALAQIHAALRPGGFFAFWENHPGNPGTRYLMSRIPFDRDAILVWPQTARQMLRTAGFEVLRTDYLFLFPRFLKWLRPCERWVTRLPLGAQYQVLVRKV